MAHQVGQSCPQVDPRIGGQVGGRAGRRVFVLERIEGEKRLVGK